MNRRFPADSPVSEPHSRSIPALHGASLARKRCTDCEGIRFGKMVEVAGGFWASSSVIRPHRRDGMGEKGPGMRSLRCALALWLIAGILGCGGGGSGDPNT